MSQELSRCHEEINDKSQRTQNPRDTRYDLPREKIKDTGSAGQIFIPKRLHEDSTHKQNETISRLGGPSSLPQPPIYIYIYIYLSLSLSLSLLIYIYIYGYMYTYSNLVQAIMETYAARAIIPSPQLDQLLGSTSLTSRRPHSSPKQRKRRSF
jgi:hypothetical protein